MWGMFDLSRIEGVELERAAIVSIVRPELGVFGRGGGASCFHPTGARELRYRSSCLEVQYSKSVRTVRAQRLTRWLSKFNVVHVLIHESCVQHFQFFLVRLDFIEYIQLDRTRTSRELVAGPFQLTPDAPRGRTRYS